MLELPVLISLNALRVCVFIHLCAYLPSEHTSNHLGTEYMTLQCCSPGLVVQLLQQIELRHQF